ncbi:MAG: hypothetical protein AAGI70_05830 [Pseudomonadota bacterium]
MRKFIGTCAAALILGPVFLASASGTISQLHVLDRSGDQVEIQAGDTRATIRLEIDSGEYHVIAYIQQGAGETMRTGVWLDDGQRHGLTLQSAGGLGTDRFIFSRSGGEVTVSAGEAGYRQAIAE